MDAAEEGAIVAAAEDAGESLQGFWSWILSLGKPLALGLFVAAVAFSTLAYWLTQIAWRLGTLLRARHRGRRRASSRVRQS